MRCGGLLRRHKAWSRWATYTRSVFIPPPRNPMDRSSLLTLLAHPSTKVMAPDSTLANLSALVSTRATAVRRMSIYPCGDSHTRGTYSLTLDDGSKLAVELRYERHRTEPSRLHLPRPASKTPKSRPTPGKRKKKRNTNRRKRRSVWTVSGGKVSPR